jgi:hypothetical protein
MLRGLLLEYIGTLLVLEAIFATHGNPFIIGLAHASGLFIGDGQSEGYFSPMAVVVQYSLGRLSLTTSAQLVGVQVLAALSCVLINK